MKKRGRAQIAMEYVLIIALGLMIILPAVFLFRNYAFESNENLVQNRLYEIGNLIMGKARKMYYYGPPSKTTLNFEMPPQVDSMFLLVYLDPADQSKNEYYLGFIFAGSKEVLIDSEVPLNATETDTVPCLYIEQCSTENTRCYCFRDKFYAKGNKIYSIKAVENCYSGSCIVIS